MCYASIKRGFDILGSVLGLLILLPAGLFIGLLIKLSDGGPILYQQTRIGRFGSPFRILKFRSMVMNADKLDVPLTKAKDPRVTVIGRFLRKSKIDELPQLWNVLVGEMSFVGPRPEVPRYVEQYTPEQRRILNYKPGITDLATVLFRNEEALLGGTEDVERFYLRHCLPKKIELNLQYEEQAGLTRDIWIILQTLCPYWVGVVAIYGLALATGLWTSYALRSDFRITNQDYESFERCLPWMVGPQLVLLVWRGQVRGLISYFSLPELRRIAFALGIALIVQIGLCYTFLDRLAPKRSIFLMDFLLSLFALCAVRMGFRFLRERSSRIQSPAAALIRRVAIIGTGELATNLALGFARSERPVRRVVAFFDDNPHMWQKRPHDIPIFGMPECLLNPEWRKEIDEVIVAMPDENPARLEEIRELLQRVQLKVTFASTWPVLTRSEA